MIRSGAVAGILLLGVISAALASKGEPEAQPFAAHQIVQKAFDNLYADDYVQVVEMSTRIGEGRELQRTFQIVRRQSERPGKALLRFTEPFDIRRTAVLVLEKESGQDDMFVFLPAIGSTRRLSASQRVSSFFGTDLSYEDIEPKRVEDYRAVLSEADGAEGGCRKLELFPKESVDSSYERLACCVDPAHGVIHWIEFYRNGAKIKRMTSDLSTVTAVGEHRIPFKVTFTTIRSGSETLLDTRSYELGGSIPESLFTTRNMEMGDALRDRSEASGLGSAP